MGDSVAKSFSEAFQAEAKRHGVTVKRQTRSGCGMITALTVNRDGTSMPWSKRCADNTIPYQRTAMRDTRAKVAIWHSTWELGYHIVDGKKVAPGDPVGDAAMLKELEAAALRITAGGWNGRLVILTVVPRAQHSDAMTASAEDRRTPALLNRLYHVLELRYPGLVTVVELDEIVCPGGPPCPETIDGVRPRPWDGGHFGGDGPAWLAPKLFDAIVAALNAPPASVASEL